MIPLVKASYNVCCILNIYVYYRKALKVDFLSYIKLILLIKNRMLG